MNIKSLDLKQLQILKTFISGNNVFMTGPAGTGKSYLIKTIKEISINTNKKCQVTALTGCASLLLDCQAKTLHSWSGVGVIKDDFNYHVRKIKSKKEKLNNWKTIDVLIVDEVSMMSKRLYELLDFIGREIRKINKPFGGIQLIFSGDFYQLPPVSKHGDNPDNAKFCFESVLWIKCFPKIHTLTKIFRQDDPIFAKILNEIRVGKIKKSTVTTLESRKIAYKKQDNIIPTRILPYRKTVDTINKREHDLLPSVKCKIYELEITSPSRDVIKNANLNPTDVDHEVDNFINSGVYMQNIEIKIGDQVICTRNMSDSIVNGSRGVVIDILQYPIVKFIDGVDTEIKPFEIQHDTIKGLTFKQIPLSHAWALTIHKCQGTTLDLCIMDIGSNIFECGQSYVALSRVKSLEGLYLTDFNPYKILINSKVKQFYESCDNTYVKLNKVDRKIAKKKIRHFINKWVTDNKCEYIEPIILIKPKTHLETCNLFKNGKTITEISKERSISISTVIAHLIKSIPDEFITYDKFMTDGEYNVIKDQLELTDIKQIKAKIDELDLLELVITYDKIKICKALHPELVKEPVREVYIDEPNLKINKELYDELKLYRLQKSKELECQAYRIFTNTVLESLSKCSIQNTDDFKKIKGIGVVFIEKYSDDVMEIISGAATAV